MWHYHVVEVACKGPRNNGGEKEIELNMTEHTALLKQQPEKKSTNWVSPEQRQSKVCCMCNCPCSHTQIIALGS